jgi:hypothetical protein
MTTSTAPPVTISRCCYEYWNYRTQDYYDPAGVMTRDQVIDTIFKSGEPENLSSVRAGLLSALYGHRQ